MSEFLVYIKIPKYERQWCEHHFGSPVKFPNKGNINHVLRHFLRLRPKDAIPQEKAEDEIAIVIPQSQSKNPASYNYLTIAGKAAIAEAIDDLFTMHLWEELNDTGGRYTRLQLLVEDWMEANGISYECVDALRQKFYRIKEAYRKHAKINVSRGYKHENL